MNEEFCRVPFLTRGTNRREDAYRLDTSKFALKNCFIWAFLKAEARANFRLPKSVKKTFYSSVAKLFHQGLAYSHIEAPFISYHKGLASATFLGKNTIKFERNREENRYDALDKILEVKREFRSIPIATFRKV
jgi:hypothetical protein